MPGLGKFADLRDAIEVFFNVPNLGDEAVTLFKSKEAGLGLSSFFDRASDLDRRSWHSIEPQVKESGRVHCLDCIGQTQRGVGFIIITFQGQRERAAC